MLSPGELELEVTLDKQLYMHEERIAVNICVRNNSNKVRVLLFSKIKFLIDIMQQFEVTGSKEDEGHGSARRRRGSVSERSVSQYNCIYGDQ